MNRVESENIPNKGKGHKVTVTRVPCQSSNLRDILTACPTPGVTKTYFSTRGAGLLFVDNPSMPNHFPKPCQIVFGTGQAPLVSEGDMLANALLNPRLHMLYLLLKQQFATYLANESKLYWYMELIVLSFNSMKYMRDASAATGRYTSRACERRQSAFANIETHAGFLVCLLVRST